MLLRKWSKSHGKSCSVKPEVNLCQCQTGYYILRRSSPDTMPARDWSVRQTLVPSFDLRSRGRHGNHPEYDLDPSRDLLTSRFWSGDATVVKFTILVWGCSSWPVLRSGWGRPLTAFQSNCIMLYFLTVEDNGRGVDAYGFLQQRALGAGRSAVTCKNNERY